MIQKIDTIKKMQAISEKLRVENKIIACVPTMGYLHEGHLSLISKARETADIVVTTLFVNPTQFGPNDDYEKYPRNVEADTKNAEKAGCDYLFVPNVDEMYSKNFQTTIHLSEITRKFEGKFRPGHFDGVVTVVAKLFNAVKPHFAVFGRKDYQQTLVIKQMVKDLNIDVDIIVVNTVREKDGLAKSSRNVYLDADSREKATILFRTLKSAERMLLNGERKRLLINKEMENILNSIEDLKIDYAAAALSDNLAEPDEFSDNDEIVLLIAAKLGNTRLIDNLIVKI